MRSARRREDPKKSGGPSPPRLEQLNKAYGSRLLVSEAVAAALGEGRWLATPLGELAVRGYAEPVRVCRLA